MDELLPFLVFAGALAAVLGGFARLASRVRRRGLAGAATRAAMASYDEAFRVTAHDSYYEIQAQVERQAPMAAPDAPWRPLRDRPPGSRPRAGSARTRTPRRRRRWWAPGR
ncbi:hypothetical protein [Streptomyces sp. NBC_00385]|uniref:hypothetical protein n=1 Tax=Streptomyces sp. NBC_00385 TaxID=2975733 RepID=UPI002DDA80BF|nr:hypothetical protein [Streptomyces sp. NBC_00385]WRZ04947.1 hypothetical protein OG959_17060 [Streptomyces sp. NBC_00385]